MRRLTWFAAMFLLALATFATAGVAANSRMTNIDQTYPGTLCGVPVTVHDLGHLITTVSGGIETDRYEFHTTFTTATGVVVLLHAAGTVSGTINPIPNGDGTYTAYVTYKGLPEQFRLPKGGLITRDAGTITIVDKLDSNFGLISEQVTTRGPHPEADSGFALECQLLGPILTV